MWIQIASNQFFPDLNSFVIYQILLIWFFDYVQAIIASKGKPFGGAPAAAPTSASGPPTPFIGVPPYVQSLMAAKAASMPFIPPSIPIGPPKFVEQLIAAKNAAMAQQAAADAALAQLQVTPA